MVGHTEAHDRKQARGLAVALIILLLALGVAALLAMPLLAEFHAAELAPGVGMKTAAIISFVLTLLVLVVFAVAAGDGPIGELQFMLLGFFAFFLVLWLLIAWVF